MRFFYLDFVRFFAAIIVLFYHYFYKSIISGKFNAAFDSVNFLKFGYLGVDFFFVISGFVIFLNYDKYVPLKFFYSRFRSIYPTFILCMLTTLLVGVYFGESLNYYQIALNMVFLPEVFGYRWVDGVYWTLFFEVFFYLLVLCFIFFRFSQRKLFVFAASWLLFFAYSNVNSLHGFFFSGYFLYFILGACFSFAAKSRQIGFPLLGLMFSSIISILIFSYWNVENLTLNPSVGDRFLVVGILIVFFVLFYKFIVQDKTDRTSPPFLRALGRGSYFIYLLHAGVGYQIAKALLVVSVSQLLFLALCIVFFSYFMARYVENLYLSFFDRYRPL